MPTATTIYDIRLRYILDETGARGGVRAMDDELKRAGHSSDLLKASLATIGAVIGGAYGIHQAKKAFIDFNAELEQSKITIAGMMQMNVGGAFSMNMERATFLVQALQQEAKKSVGTTKDMVEMLSMVAQPLTAAGAKMQDLVDISKGAVVASRSMGFDATTAAMQIREALTGVYSQRQQFTTALLAPMGYGGEEGRKKFRGLDEAKRLEVIKQALTSTAIKEMAGAQEHSFSGALSTLQDNLEITLGKVGLPLFKAVTDELNHWNTWIENNGAELERMGRTLSDALMSGFGYVKTVISFISEHKDLLLSIAEAWLVFKGAGMLTGGGGKIWGAFTAFSGEAGAATMGLTKFAGKLSAATEGIGAIAVAATALAAYIDSEQSKRLTTGRNSTDFGIAADMIVKAMPGVRAAHQTGTTDALDLAANKGTREAVSSLYSQLNAAGLIGAGGNLDQTRAIAQIANPAADQSRRYMLAALQTTVPEDKNIFGASSEDVARAAVKSLAEQFGDLLKEEFERRNKPANLEINKNAPASKPPSVNVHIHRIEVASDDPDRFVFQLTEGLRRVAKNPSQAATAFREGG